MFETLAWFIDNAGTFGPFMGLAFISLSFWLCVVNR
jgi:hypothetical protein